LDLKDPGVEIETREREREREREERKLLFMLYQK